MNYNVKRILALFCSAIFTALIAKIVVDPIYDKILSLIALTPGKISTFFMNPLCSKLPNYERYSLIYLASYIAIGGLGGHTLYLISLQPSNDDDPEDTDESIEPSEETMQSTSKIMEALSGLLFVVYDSICSWSRKHMPNIFFVTVFFVLNFFALQSILITAIASDTLKKIEIVSPYIEDTEYKRLKSDFFLIENWNDYDQLDKKIDAIMESEGLS